MRPASEAIEKAKGRYVACLLGIVESAAVATRTGYDAVHAEDVDAAGREDRMWMAQVVVGTLGEFLRRWSDCSIPLERVLRWETEQVSRLETGWPRHSHTFSIAREHVEALRLATLDELLETS